MLPHSFQIPDRTSSKRRAPPSGNEPTPPLSNNEPTLPPPYDNESAPPLSDNEPPPPYDNEPAPPTIPTRTPSKRRAPLSEQSYEELTTDQLSHQSKDLNDEIKRAKKKLRPQASFDVPFWSQQAKFFELKRKFSDIDKELKIRNYQGTREEWVETEEAEQVQEQKRKLDMEEKQCLEQAERLNSIASKLPSSRQKSWMQLFTTSSLGLDIKGLGQGRRDTTLQSNFRKDLILAYNVQHPDPDLSSLWCPVLSCWVPGDYTTVAHLFAYKHGQEMMEDIFGKDSENELFSPSNGLILSNAVESIFDLGVLAIVPNIPDPTTPEQLKSWTESEPKSYKIRILDPNHPKVQNKISAERPIRWKDLDGHVLEFRNDFRPRARYLFFVFCTQLLKMAWRERDGHILKPEFGKVYWGTMRRYVARNQISTLIKEIGHVELEYLQDVGKEVEEETIGDKNLLLTAAANQATAKRRFRDYKLDEDEDEDETDEDETEEDETDGDETDENETDGDETDGDETDENETDEDETDEEL